MPSSAAAAATSSAPCGGVTTTMRSTPAACAGTAHMTSVETSDARDVDADRRERHPAPLELDARLDLERGCRPAAAPRASAARGRRARAPPRSGRSPPASRAPARRRRARSDHSRTRVVAARAARRRRSPRRAHAEHPLERHEQDRRRARRLERGQQPPDVLRRHDAVHGDHARLGERQHARRARAGNERADRLERRPPARSASGTARRARRRRCGRRRRAAAPSSRGSRGPIEHGLGLEQHARPSAGRSCAACCRSRRGRRSRRRDRGAARARPSRARRRARRPGSSSRASRGKLVATRAPRRSSSDCTVDSVGTAASSEQAPKPSRTSSATSAPRSRTMSRPVIPQSTTPSCTYSGMSSARTSSASTGAFRHGNASARSPGVSGPSPASCSSSIAGSRRRPFEGTAILSGSSGAGVAARARSRPRRSGATAPRASPSSSRRAPARATSRYGSPSVEELRHLPAVRHRVQLRPRAEIAEEALHLVRIPERGDRREELRCSSSANVGVLRSRMPSCYHSNTLIRDFAILPAVDVLDGKAVRLLRGDYDRIEVDAGDPLELVRRAAQPAPPLVHVVALGAARDGGAPVELAAAAVAAAAPVPVQLGGGVRSPADAEALRGRRRRARRRRHRRVRRDAAARSSSTRSGIARRRDRRRRTGSCARRAGSSRRS